MLHTDARFSEAVERAVEALEKRTDAEIVVVASERSGHYRDVAMFAASTLSFVLLLVLLFAPFDVHPASVPIEIGLTWLIGAWLFNGRHPLRVLAPRRRQIEQVRLAAHAEFHREAVHGTPNRTGLLVYVSGLEGRVELVPDAGLEGRIPRGVWAKATQEFSHDDLDHFLAGLQAIGEVLAEHVPALEVDEIDLPNAPRIRP